MARAMRCVRRSAHYTRMTSLLFASQLISPIVRAPAIKLISFIDAGYTEPECRVCRQQEVVSSETVIWKFGG